VIKITSFWKHYILKNYLVNAFCKINYQENSAYIVEDQIAITNIAV